MLDSIKTRISPVNRLVIIALLLVAGLASDFAPRASAASSDATAPEETQAGTRIVGGYYPSQPWPWIASIEDTRDGASDYQQHFCGGALIHPRLVVTAAHCVLDDNGQQSVPIGSLEVMLGKTQLSAPGGEQIAVSHVVVHPNYGTPTGIAHDMALLFLSRSSAQQPATILSPSVQLREGNIARVMGWGQIRGGGDWNDPTSRTDHLKGIDLAIWSDANCARAGQNQADQSAYRTFFDSQTMICAGFRPDSPDGTCNGDSGGPMMVYDSAGNWYLTGLVSWGGWDCTGYNSPSVFSWLQNPSMSQMLQQGIVDAQAGTYLNPVRTTTSTTQRWMNASLSRKAARVGRNVRLAVSAAGYQYVRIAIKRRGRIVSNRTVTPGRAIALPTRRQGQLRITVSALNADGSRGQTKVLKLRVYR